MYLTRSLYEGANMPAKIKVTKEMGVEKKISGL